MKRHSQYLTISIICFAIAITGLVMLWQGCSTLSNAIGYSDHARQIECVGIAAAIASEYSVDYPTRLCLGFAPGTSYGHVQTEIKVNGKWEAVQLYTGFKDRYNRVLPQLWADIGRKDDYYVKEFYIYLKPHKSIFGLFNCERIEVIK